MRKTILLLVTTSAILVGMNSCKKEETEKAAIQQSISATLRNSESYTFILPENLRDDAYEITTAASHSSVSLVAINSDGNQVYKYTPETGYVGTDKVVVSNDEERTQSGNHPASPPPPPRGPKPPKCNGGEEDHYIVTINFVVDKAIAAISR